jgi:hypothetical protein
MADEVDNFLATLEPAAPQQGEGDEVDQFLSTLQPTTPQPEPRAQPDSGLTPVEPTEPKPSVTESALDIADTVTDVVEPVKNPITGFLTNLVTGADRQTEETQQFPELFSAEGFSNVLAPEGDKKEKLSLKELFGASAQALAPTSELKDAKPGEEVRAKTFQNIAPAMNIVAQGLVSMNPDSLADTVLKSVEGSKLEEDSKGNKFILFPNGNRAVVNKPGFSNTDAVNLIGEITTHALGAGVVSKFLTKGGGFMNRVRNIVKQSGGVGLVELAQEVTSRAAGSDQPFDPVNLGVAMATEGLTLGTGGLIRRGIALRNISRAESKAIGTVSEVVEQLSDANLDRIDLVENFANTAKVASKIPDITRKRFTHDIYNLAYEEARKNKLVINIDDIIQNIDDAKLPFDPVKGGLKNVVKPKTLKHLNKIKSTLQSAAASTKSGSNLEALANAKRDLYEVVESLEKKKKVNSAKNLRRLTDIYTDQLREKLKDSSSAFEVADGVFSSLSPEVKKVEKIFKDFNKLEGDDLLKAADKMFNKSTSRKTINKMKTLIEKVNPGSWVDIQRANLLRASDKIGDNVDIKALFKEFIGTQSKKDKVFAAAGINGRKNISFMNAAVRASEELNRGGFLGNIGNSFASFYASPFRGANVRLLEFMPEKQAKDAILAELMFNDDFVKAVTQLRTKPLSPQAARNRVNQLLDRAAFEVLDDQILTVLTQSAKNIGNTDALQEEE